MNTLTLAAALLATTLPAAAQTPAVDFDRGAVAAPLSGGDLGAGFKALRTHVKAEAVQPRSYAIPRDPQDAFNGVGGCNVVDAVYIRAFTLDEAVNVLAPCMHTLSLNYAATLTAEKTVVALGDGQPSVPGIQLRLSGPTFTGNPVLMNLRHALELRRGHLMGFPAVVADGAFSAMTSPANPSAVPTWIDAASLRIDPRQTRVIGVEGGLRVVMFDKNDNQVEFEVPTAQQRGASVQVTFTKLDDSQAGPFAVDSLQRLNPGELGRLVAGVSIPGSLDARTRGAVESLFTALRS